MRNDPHVHHDPMTHRSHRSAPDAGRVHTGTAGWSIPGPQRVRFGDGGSVLARYATRFDVVEVNSSFYRPHRRDTWARWAATVPPGFRFCAKLPRAITHEHRLRGAMPLLDDFLAQAAEGLGDRLGCLLVQLPPGLPYEGRSAGAFFAALRRRWAGGVACEPRHPSWFAPPVDALWLRHRIARVAADPAPVAAAAEPGGDASLCYWRWHGAPRMYYSRYAGAALEALAARVSTAVSAGAAAWVVFDNTAHGHAASDALAFQALMGKRAAAVPGWKPAAVVS